MPNFSGTVTSKQGVLTIDITPNDVVTFTPTAATYTVEYPIGTVAINASSSTSTVTGNTAATQVRILCVSGSVAYSCVDGPDGSSSSSASQSLGSVSGAVAINLGNGPNVSLTTSGATTISFTGTPGSNTSQRVVLTITNGSTNITWPGATRWAGAGIVGSAPTLSASGTDKIVIDIINIGGSLTYDASYIGRVA